MELHREQAQLDLRPEYGCEGDFIQQLNKWLVGKQIVEQKQGDSIRITPEAESHKNQQDRPDITVHQRGGQVGMKHRDLSKPFYIECKLGREFGGSNDTSLKQINNNLNQLVRYKYDRGSQSHDEMEKYGDNHIVVTTPYLLTGNVNLRDFTASWVNPAQLTRTLWKLGIGIFYRADNGNYRIDFNENEVLTVERR